MMLVAKWWGTLLMRLHISGIVLMMILVMMILVMTMSSMAPVGIQCLPGETSSLHYRCSVSDYDAVTNFTNVTCRAIGNVFYIEDGGWVPLTPGELGKVRTQTANWRYAVQVIVNVFDSDGVDAVWIVSERQSDGLVVNDTMHRLEDNKFGFLPPEMGGPVITNNSYSGGFSTTTETPESGYEEWNFRFYARDMTGEVVVSEEYLLGVSIVLPDYPPTTTTTSFETMTWIVTGSIGIGVVVAIIVVFLHRRRKIH